MRYQGSAHDLLWVVWTLGEVWTTQTDQGDRCVDRTWNEYVRRTIARRCSGHPTRHATWTMEPMTLHRGLYMESSPGPLQGPTV